MSADTNLKCRGGVYYCRRRVPKDLLGHYGGKKEFAISLGTKSLREARGLGREQWLKWETEFEALRQSNGTAQPITHLTDEQIRALADGHYAGVLKWDEHDREQGLSEEDFQARGAEVAGSYLPAALARGDMGRAGFLAHLTLKNHGLALPKDSPSYRKLTYALLKAHVRADEAVQMRQQGKVVDTPDTPRAAIAPTSVPRRGSGSVGLADVLDKWAAERSPRPKTLSEWSGVVRDFNKLNGDLSLDGIEKKHVVAFKDKLVESKRAPGTVKKYVAVIHALLEYALHNDLCERNAAAGVRVVGGKSRTREHLSLGDLQRLFSGNVFTRGTRPRGGSGEAAFWLPLLSLFSGARLEELGQMLVQDVRREDGIDYFEVTDQGEGQKLKTHGSRRSVPIHPELLRLGLLGYVEERRVAGDVRVFPLLKQDSDGKWTANWSAWWLTYRRSVGVTERWRDFHALRHTFKRQCRECGIAKDIHTAITGHASTDVGDSYGGAFYPLRPMSDAMKTLRYEGLDLAGVKRREAGG